MPLITTHNYFANDVFNIIPKKISQQFSDKKGVYELFAQGFDLFQFYDFFRLKRENLLDYCHNHYTDLYFLNYIKNLKKLNYLQNPEFLAALYGHLTHYVLDSNCHPYIVYKTGIWNPKLKETHKYNGLHSKMEMQIDAYFYEQKNHKPFENFKIHKYLITKDKLSKELINHLNTVYLETFSIKNGGKKYNIGKRNMYYSYKFLIEDKTGIKTNFYKFIDIFTPHTNKFQNYSAHIKEIDQSIFNENHDFWYHPWLDNAKYNTSFFDIYNKALEEAKNLIIKTDEFLHDKITEKEYYTYLQDKSYLTGLSWKKKGKIKHLEF